MKHMLVLLMAAMLVFSFAGCTQYDFSALEDFWQNQNEETEKAQETADKADISSIFGLTFADDAKNVSIEYSEDRAELMASRAAADKELFAKATYTGFEIGNGSELYGSLLFAFNTSFENGTYSVSSYTAEMIGRTPLTLTVDGESHELEVEVRRSTEASGTITASGDVFTAAVSLEEPSKRDLSVRLDNQNVDAGKEEEPSRLPVSGDITYNQMLKDFFSLAASAMSCSYLTESIEVPEDGGTFNIMADNNVKVGDATFTSYNGSLICTDFSITSSGSYTKDGDTFSWTGTAYLETNGTESTYIFNNFQIKEVPESVMEIPLAEFAVINGYMTTSASDSELNSMFADADLQFDSRDYGTDDLMTMTLLTVIPMNLASYEFAGASGEISIPEAENAGFDFSVSWTSAEDGSISITDGLVNAEINSKKYSYAFELGLTAPMETSDPEMTKRGISSFRFGATADSFSDIDAEILNFIMQTAN